MRHLEELVSKVRAAAVRPAVAVVWPGDASSLGAMSRAVESGLARVTAVGCREAVEKRFGGAVEVVDAPDAATAAISAVRLVNEGRAQLLMKGLVNTDVLLRAVLDKERGLMTPGSVLTHVTIGEIPSYSKLLLLSDVAVMPCPNDAQREVQLRLLLSMCRRLGIECPRVALVHCSEKVDARHFPVTVGYRDLVRRAAAGEFGDCIVDGPLDVKTACDAHAAEVKGIDSPLKGEADVLLFPEIESGNAFYKAMTLFAGMKTAALVCGARVPMVVPSRGDDELTKFYSLAAAVGVSGC